MINNYFTSLEKKGRKERCAMKRLNGYRIRLVLVGVVAAVVLGGRRANAEYIMSEPTSVGPVINDATDVQECDFSHDGLELYYASERPGGYGVWDIWVAKRETLNSPWQEPVNLGPSVNSSAGEVEPSISGDGLELYFRLWDDRILRVCTRPSKDAPWSSPVKVGPPVGSYNAYEPDISADGLSLYFASGSARGGYGKADLWVATRTTTDDEWGEPVNLGPNVNGPVADYGPSISSDGLALAFYRFSPRRLLITTRKSIDDDWEPAVGLVGMGMGPAFSPDGSTIYFDSGGISDIWQARFIPIVDLNVDGIVDATDMCIMVDNWGTDYSLCDIGPMPWGDGIVDVQDLIVLAEHLFEEDFPPELVAYWKLDETEGDIAYYSTGYNHGILSGNPIWQPNSGQVAGALEFDGIDDYISTDFVLNPADGPFSIFAWINGGAPGQVVVSQQGVDNWLAVDAEGNLMTELKCTGRFTDPLFSETVITDGQWHRIGLVWDGSNRILYVDGVAVAEDTKPGLQGSQMGLYIGVGKNYETGTFFSGLIDDVRIYNVALTAEEIVALAQ